MLILDERDAPLTPCVPGLPRRPHRAGALRGEGPLRAQQTGATARYCGRRRHAHHRDGPRRHVGDGQADPARIASRHGDAIAARGDEGRDAALRGQRTALRAAQEPDGYAVFRDAPGRRAEGHARGIRVRPSECGRRRPGGRLHAGRSGRDLRLQSQREPQVATGRDHRLVRRPERAEGPQRIRQAIRLAEGDEQVVPQGQPERQGRTVAKQKSKASSGEIALDIESVRGTCRTCRILLIEANNGDDADLATAENRAAAMGATEISNSFGEPEQQGAGEDSRGLQPPAAS